MSGNTNYANFQAESGSVNNEVTLDFNLKNRVYTIFNDSNTDDLRFKFAQPQTFGIILPLQSVEIQVVSRTVIIESVGSVNVDYRVWGQG